ncbi:MAG: transposase [Deltaproteobacteria bacterium]|nr:transposase [Deltaproteobacteria bacterium]MBW2151030.1 transposase [Deltaproteobacteria bacterium]
MARAWRIEFEGALYHVLSRGNERRDIFFCDHDRRMFLSTLGEMADRFAIEPCAYVLMNNHYHLLLHTLRANLSKAMQWFGVTYTNRFNARHSRSGHLFQGRFKSMVVQNDAYLLRLSLYIHRNPLRAGLVERLADYRWSSYRVYAYGKHGPDWLKTERVFNQFQNVKDRHAAYRKLIQQYAEEEQRLLEDLRHGFILGTEQFVELLKNRFLLATAHREVPQQKRVLKDVDLAAILAKAGLFLGCKPEDFKKAARIAPSRVLNRDLLLYLIWQLGVLTNSEIGCLFGLTGSAVSRRVRVLKDRASVDKEIQRKIEGLKSIIEI